MSYGWRGFGAAFVVLAVAVTLCLLLGSRLRPWLTSPGQPRSARRMFELMAGVTLVHLVMSLFDLAGLAWHPLTLGAALLAAGAGFHTWGRYRHAMGGSLAFRGEEPGWGWGDTVAAAAFGLFVLWAFLGWAVNPDFLYHWGAKAHRYFAQGGLDAEFLTRPWQRYAHPGYPHLLPHLFGATAILGRAFREPALFGWTALFGVALWPAARGALAASGAGAFARQAGLAAVALVTAQIGIGYLLPGGPDLLLALVPVAAWPALARCRERAVPADDYQIGLLAAFAAGAKTEGVVLAAILVTVHLARRLGTGLLAAAARTVLPPALVIALWQAIGRTHGLFVEQHFAGLHTGRLPTVLAAAGEALATPEWRGVSWLVLLLPLLLLVRRARPVALVLLLQLGFYLGVYLVSPASGPDAIRFYVLSSFPRLLFHVMPATLLGLVLVADGGRARFL